MKSIILLMPLTHRRGFYKVGYEFENLKNCNEETKQMLIDFYNKNGEKSMKGDIDYLIPEKKSKKSNSKKPNANKTDKNADVPQLS
jgi:hypothetical protein